MSREASQGADISRPSRLQVLGWNQIVTRRPIVVEPSELSREERLPLRRANGRGRGSTKGGQGCVKSAGTDLGNEGIRREDDTCSAEFAQKSLLPGKRRRSLDAEDLEDARPLAAPAQLAHQFPQRGGVSLL